MSLGLSFRVRLNPLIARLESNRETSSKQIPNNSWRCLDGCVDLRLVLAAGFGELRLAAALSADQLGYRAHNLACLDALGESRRDSGN